MMRFTLMFLTCSVSILTTITAPIRPPSAINSDVPQKKQKVDTGPRCKLLFSEIKFGKPMLEDDYPFIELKADCEKRRGPLPKNPFANYHLLVLEANPLRMNMKIDFSTIILKDYTSYFVVGSPKVPNVDISLANPHLQSAFSTTEDNRMLPGDGLYAVVLLKDLQNTHARRLNLWIDSDGQMTPKTLASEQVKLIQNHMADMVIVGAENQISKNEFSIFWPNSHTNVIQKIFIPVWKEFQSSGVGESINICDISYQGFNTAAFSLKSESPGLPNNCETDNIIDQSTEQCDLPVKYPSNPIHQVTPDQLIQIKNPFLLEWVTDCQHLFPKNEQLLTSPQIQNWLRFHPDPKCKFTCVACKSYLDSGFRPDVKRKSNMVKNGYFSKNIYDNRDVIRKHQENKLHLEAEEFFNKLKVSTISDTVTVIQEFESRELITFNATMNVVVFVYAEMKAGISFRTHETLMKALRLMGANVGWLQHSENAAQIITKVISRNFHEDLLQKLVKDQPYFSILVDSSTNSNQPFLAVYFQLMENDTPVTHFYSLVHMEKGEKANDMTNSLVEQIKNDNERIDGFELWFKSKIASISSDGAAVMVGPFESFRVYISKYIGRSIPNIVCLAHNLDRSYKIGIKAPKKSLEKLDSEEAYDNAKMRQLTYFENFDKSIKKLYTFYGSRGHKKWQHFLESADYLEEIPTRFKYPHDIRWSETLYDSTLAVHHNWFPLVFDVDEISTDKDFDKSAKATATELHHLLTDKTFSLALHEFLDILSTFKIASKLFQQSSSIVTGKVEIIYGVIDSLKQYQLKPGKWLEGFLKGSVCSEECDEGDCSLDDFDTCDSAIVRGMRLEHQYPVAMTYTEVRQGLYKNLLTSLATYFKLEMLESFEILNPSRLVFQDVDRMVSTASVEDKYLTVESHKAHHVHKSYQSRFNFLCEFYYFNNTGSCGTLLNEWNNVLNCITSNQDLKTYSDSDATIFWPKALKKCNCFWSTLTTKFVQLALVTPFSSSECERGFSIMNHIKTKSRSRLEKDTLDSIMKLKINGPELEDFPAYKMTAKVLNVLVRVDDPEFQNSKKVDVCND